MNAQECIDQAELLLREVAQEGAVAHTQIDRQRVRDMILTAQAYATLAQAKATLRLTARDPSWG